MGTLDEVHCTRPSLKIENDPLLKSAQASERSLQTNLHEMGNFKSLSGNKPDIEVAVGFISNTALAT
jgi:hypothetical protein